MVTGHQNQLIKFWKSDTLTEKYTYNVPSAITQIGFTKRREIMGTSDNANQLNIYSMWPPSKQHSIYHKSRINAFCFAKTQDIVAAACDDRSILLWNINRKNSSSVSYVSTRTVTSVDFPVTDSFMVTGHQDGKIRIWDLNDRRVQGQSG